MQAHTGTQPHLHPTSFALAVKLQKGDAAAQEAENWQQNASAWCAALLQQHPLYRDLLQPMALAVYEVRCGLSLLKHAVAPGPEQQLADDLLADCLTLPSRLGQGWCLLLACLLCLIAPPPAADCLRALPRCLVPAPAAECHIAPSPADGLLAWSDCCLLTAYC